ncbi:hypothetical protein GGD38_005001 [Chitinophagaceae bacterium OAS944]|nr:hypothetical protein [Chitinophagaceae bacterium OAS944]
MCYQSNLPPKQLILNEKQLPAGHKKELYYVGLNNSYCLDPDALFGLT